MKRELLAALSCISLGAMLVSTDVDAQMTGPAPVPAGHPSMPADDGEDDPGAGSGGADQAEGAGGDPHAGAGRAAGHGGAGGMGDVPEDSAAEDPTIPIGAVE